MARHYIFGYGSLINAECRARTGDSGGAIPVRVEGLKRGWNKVSSSSKWMSVVGVVLENEAVCNGVIFPVSERELSRFDEREIGYRRIEIEYTNVSFLSQKQSSRGRVWGYVVNSPVTPTERHPIAQSYVDVIITGCLYFGEEFAAEFVRTTANWDYPWVDDRQRPRYVRHIEGISSMDQIDKILSRLISEVFKRRKTV